MAIIRQCSSEPKVNQCLKHLLLLLDTKSFIPPPSLHLVWIKMSTAKIVLLCYCCAELGGLVNAVLCSSLVGPQQSSPYAYKNSAFVAGQGLAFRDYYTLNQTNDHSIMRTVYTGLFVPVSINYWVWSWTSAKCYCSLYIHCDVF